MASSKGTCSCRGAAVLVIAIAAIATLTAMVRAASTDKEHADHQHVAERDERDQDTAEERGGRSPQDTHEFGTRGHAGMTMMPAFKTSSRILSSAKTFL